MKVYVLTVFDSKGKLLVDEKFEANNDNDGKKIGEQKLALLNYQGYTSRVTRSSGGLVLFHQ
ncbi:YhzD family protein [Anaerobacillus isosaccharinicus]|uniref:YhzD family protein n=1 Tax=Anaerobacillus isosaccharinicus TaxID=1532552 RepID=A0A7S7L8K1_9BACI|nr:YhzD family protein [Anaerobacillus isosaccharinicus]MBA5585298.1 hypothetical protein [Anaerobacillus isosaccharinicus]QOY36375.1 hypothetical protein AWH56_001365 [Anaerobacillus isosaccharinicus]